MGRNKPPHLTCVGFLPVTHECMSPKRARKWFEREQCGWHDLIAETTKVANAEEQEVLGDLTYWLGNMVQACGEAIAEDRTVEVDCNLRREKSSWGDAKSLAVVIRAASKLPSDSIGTPGKKALQDVCSELVALCASGGVQADRMRCESATDARTRHEGEVAQLLQRSETLEARAGKLDEQLRKRFDELTEAELEPDFREADCLRYEAGLLAHENLARAHPGEPPEGWAER